MKDYSIKNTMSSLFETVGILKLRFRTGNRKAAYKKVSFLQKHPFWWNLAFFFRKSLYQKCSNRSIICWPTSIFSPWMDFVSFVHMNKQSDGRENHLWYGIRVLAEPTRGLGSQGTGPRAYPSSLLIQGGLFSTPPLTFYPHLGLQPGIDCPEATFYLQSVPHWTHHSENGVFTSGINNDRVQP